MWRIRSRWCRFQLELLEARLELAATFPANSIGTSFGSVLQPRAASTAAVTVASRNLTVGKPSTLLGIFVSPTSGSGLAPHILAVTEASGRRLAIKQGRPFVAGRDDNQAAAFVKVDEPGPLTIFATGQDHTTGAYQVDVTLVGDVNGNASVNLADLAPFARAYSTAPGNPSYNAAADFNLDGIVNQIDAKALMQNMPPLTPKVPLELVMNLAPADQAHYAAPKNSGGSTLTKEITIEGHTMPGSIVLEDTTKGFYKWSGGALATDAAGNFSVTEKNTEGVNTYDFLVIDPYGRQLIRSYPVYWIPFAAPRSKLG
jgi:hypothetical protein